MLTVTPATHSDAVSWDRFVQGSNDGTIQHELAFLAYHPPGRFRFEHLIVRDDAEIVAVVPGGIVEHNGNRTFVSPQGASVGGPVIARPTLADALAVVDALKQHALVRGWTALEFVAGPSSYHRVPSDATAFALFAKEFRLIQRDLSFVVPLAPGTADGYEKLFRKKQAWSVRSAERRGVTVTHGGEDLLNAFFPLFRETYERHGTNATHTEAEIADLIRRFPGRVEITIAARDGIPLSGLLVFRLNDRAAQTFYICSSTEHQKENGTVAALSGLIDRLAGAGVRSLDLGVSATPSRINEGVVFFKEGLGAAGQARDHWRWDAAG